MEEEPSSFTEGRGCGRSQGLDWTRVCRALATCSAVMLSTATLRSFPKSTGEKKVCLLIITFMKRHTMLTQSDHFIINKSDI